MKKLMIICCVALFSVILFADETFRMDSFDEWDAALNGTGDNEVRPMSPVEWADHMAPWSGPDVEGEPYLYGDPVTFLPCGPEPWKLYVHDGSDYPESEDDAGLVMAWGDETSPPDDGNYASGWEMVYGADPDLSNSLVQVTVSPPPPPGTGAGITAISFAFVDTNGLRRVWWWSVGPGGIPYGVPTTVKIDGGKTGINAASPVASGYANAPGFDITKVVSFDVDENFNYIFGTVPVPPPGQQNFVMAWNYWHNLLVISNQTRAYKGNYVKFSQPPYVVDPNEPPLIYGWDVRSFFPANYDQGVWFNWAADDWKCYDERPVTDVHWWGSFIGWTQPHLPPQVPDYFLMAIWTDVQADLTGQPPTSSHPKSLLWLHQCDNWVWNFAGYDKDPRWDLTEPPYNIELFGVPQENEACFQFNQLLSEDDYFYQEPMDVLADGTVVPNVYWFSISAVYLGVNDIGQIQYPWGWKSKPYDSEKAPDPAVVIDGLDQGTPPWDTALNPGTGGHVTNVTSWYPLILPDPGVYPDPTASMFDLAFELTTNEPKCPGLTADLNGDCIVNLPDFAQMASEWLLTSP